MQEVRCEEGLVDGLLLDPGGQSWLPGIEPLAVHHKKGKITEFGKSKAGKPESSDEFFEVFCPGFVNPHTHLELSLFAGKLPQPEPGNFPEWAAGLWRLKEEARAEHGEDWAAIAVKQGVEMSLRAGVTLIGDIVSEPAALRAINESPIPTIAYCEAIGPDPGRLDVSLDRLLKLFEVKLKKPHRRGLSPHAPHTVCGALSEKLRKLHQEKELPVAIHVAETRAETEFLANGTGLFAEMFQNIGLHTNSWPEVECESPIQRLDRLGWLPNSLDGDSPMGKYRERSYFSRIDDSNNSSAPGTLLIHGNYITKNEADILREKNIATCFCPETHAFFKHEPWPVPTLEDFPVVLGTDSLASAWSLSPLEQLRRVLRDESLKALWPRVFSGTTLSPRDLMLGHKRENMRADYTVLRIKLEYFQNGSLESEKLRAILLDAATEVTGTIINGRWAWRAEAD